MYITGPLFPLILLPVKWRHSQCQNMSFAPNWEHVLCSQTENMSFVPNWEYVLCSQLRTCPLFPTENMSFVPKLKTCPLFPTENMSFVPNWEHVLCSQLRTCPLFQTAKHEIPNPQSALMLFLAKYFCLAGNLLIQENANSESCNYLNYSFYIFFSIY
jgi:hypothetical protein